MSNPKNSTSTWGFRFSKTDGIVIGMFLSAMAILGFLGSVLWWILAIALVHFFLFCNVFRISRPFELIWAALFVLNVGVWAWFDCLTWQHILLCQLPVTVNFLILEMLSPLYHGIFANRLNRRLHDYLEGVLRPTDSSAH